VTRLKRWKNGVLKWTRHATLTRILIELNIRAVPEKIERRQDKRLVHR